ncbi:MAG: hypothetical protein JNG89_08720 [Planctomycetaceae bacterium]|nr:hypothetical protein [Planctomycetaceae bacterium]
MLRHTTFAIVSLFACGVASAQQPLTPYWNYNGQSVNPGYTNPNGYYGSQGGSCVGGNCATGNCPTGARAQGGMICGPNGCYAPGTAPGSSTSQYWPRLPQMNWPFGSQNAPVYRTQPAYSTPGSTYPAFPNIPSARRDRYQPTAGGVQWHGNPAVTGHPSYYSPITGQANPYDSYSGGGVLY